MAWIIVLLLVALLVESAVFPGLLTVGIRPDLALVIVVGWASLRGWEEGIIVGLVAGLLADATSAGPFGVHLVRLGLIGGLAGFGMERLARTTPLFPVVAVLLAAVPSFMITLIALQASGYAMVWERALFGQAFPNALLSALAMVAVYPLLRAIDRRGRPAPEEAPL